MSVTARTLRLQAALEQSLTRVTDQQTRQLVSAWADAWDEVAPDLTATLLEMLVSGDKVTRAQLLRSTRLRQALAVIADQLETLAEQAGVTITGDLAQVIDTAGAAQASIVDSQVPPGRGIVDLASWARVDAAQIDAIVRRSTEQITSLTNALSPQAYDVVRRELIRGVAAGTSPRDTAARIVRRAEQGFNGGLNRALTIARTETLDAHRAAAALGQAQQTEVLTGWVWLADFSGRVCPACLSQHGTRHPLDDPGPLGHQNCRCDRMPVAKTWAELGFPDIAEPASVLPDAKTWFDGLSGAEQRHILGPTRLTAYQAGDYPISAWSTRRTTAGWRDSYAVSPAPKPRAGRAAA